MPFTFWTDLSYNLQRHTMNSSTDKEHNDVVSTNMYKHIITNNNVKNKLVTSQSLTSMSSSRGYSKNEKVFKDMMEKLLAALEYDSTSTVDSCGKLTSLSQYVYITLFYE